MFEMLALCANTSTQTVLPCIDRARSFNNVLLQTNPDFNQSLLEFIHILERRLIDPLLHDPPELVTDQIEVRALGGYRSGEMKSEVSRSNCSIVLRANALIHCPAETCKRCTSLAQTAVIRFLCDLISSLLMFVVHFSAYFVCSVFPR